MSATMVRSVLLAGLAQPCVGGIDQRAAVVAAQHAAEPPARHRRVQRHAGRLELLDRAVELAGRVIGERSAPGFISL